MTRKWEFSSSEVCLVSISESREGQILSFTHPCWFFCLEIQQCYRSITPSQAQSNPTEVNDIKVDQNDNTY